MSVAVSLLLLLLHLMSDSSAMVSRSPAPRQSRSPEISPLGPVLAPPYYPKYRGSMAKPPSSKHHRRIPRAISPSPYPASQDCDEISCSEPLTSTPLGSPCGCVYPIKVVMDIGVAPFVLFTHTAELEVEVAAGTFLRQSQVKIMAVYPTNQDQQKTRVTIYLVPLGERFDNTTAVLIYERLWQKKMPINMSIFGDYQVVYVQYPGLPASPPSNPRASMGFGPNQQYPLTADVPTTKSEKLKTGIIVVIAVSSFALVLACFGVVLLLLKWRKLRRPSTAISPAITPSLTKRSVYHAGIRSTLSNSTASSMSVSFVSTMATCPPSVKTFSLAELEKATDGFSSKRVLGEGGFGRVYKGMMENESEVAVKLLTREDRSGDREFIAEVEMLSRLHHRNLVKLIGICIEGNRRCLVYELVRNGSVESHLHGVDKKKGLLNWDSRMKIALGAARGLAYLHEDSNPRVIHRDFKASNILLEEDFTPKVTDFGLAREASEGSHHISTRVMGTFGYVAPEYAMTGHLLVKSDVYSYGVVLLELLSGRKPVYISESQEGPENLVTWARPLLNSREGLEKLIDPTLNKNYNFEDVAKVASIASVCVHIDPSQRPFMGEVVQALKLVYKDMDENNDDLYSRRESSSGTDFVNENSWWNAGSPSLAYGNNSPFITMEYSSDPMEELNKPHSASSLAGKAEPMALQNRSGPLRTKKKKFAAFYRLRGSISEHGHLFRKRSNNR
ncbi:receptor-like serine/threonine-protein kinase ALE2 isoform X1 [Ananas comosus]|uniref:Receptor-like serine/threonine-protein kinase ALE2 isoform X1 n=1 Tax=Ananas comosus TaxID=4615 RepID=A0A6P5E9E5_ANACO|nr:receptor-like serine/threonine-protein kinase ALE2 isoform X1 [Ananas comosus]